MNTTLKKILTVLGYIVGAAVAAFLILIIILQITEFNPKETEPIENSGDSSLSLSIGDSFSVLSWNIGYCGLSETADFFMDGGADVLSLSKEQTESNVSAISNFLTTDNSEVIFLQEVDTDSHRSYNIDELSSIISELRGYTYGIAYNYKCLFVPYPLPPIGKVNSGISTIVKYGASETYRVAMPSSFSWPVRLANLKRGLLINRIPIKGSDKELVLVNLHLEAYDSGEGKALQTKIVADLLKEEYEKGNYVVAGGDFNQVFSHLDMSDFPIQSEDLWKPGKLEEEDFSSNFNFYMDNTSPSCRSLDRPYDRNDNNFQFYVIDGFIVSDNLNVKKMETIDLDFKNSDHNPIKIQLSIKD